MQPLQAQKKAGMHNALHALPKHAKGMRVTIKTVSPLYIDNMQDMQSLEYKAPKAETGWLKEISLSILTCWF